jgi:SNF2 family DNA or RNA helicase
MVDVNGQGQLFAPIARSMTEVRHDQQGTVSLRCEKAIELAMGKTSVYWCNLNTESAMLKELDNEAIEIIGSQSIEKKEDILLNFANGNIKRIITKAKMTGMGLNWQHCNHSVFFPTWSYEQYYQALRRFWRFGQVSDVNIDLVVSDGQQRVLDSIEQKTQKSIHLYQSLIKNVNGSFADLKKEFNKQIQKPSFL